MTLADLISDSSPVVTQARTADSSGRPVDSQREHSIVRDRHTS